MFNYSIKYEMGNIIDTDCKLDDLCLIKYLKNINSVFLPKIIEVYDQVKDILNTRVQVVFSNYTLHNTGHSFRIMEYMSKLVSDLGKLNELEIVLLVYAALLHDIGMAVSSEDITLIKDDNFSFCETKFSAMKKIKEGNDELALQEYVRRIHAILSARYINDSLKEKLVIPKLVSLDFTKELALICQSHTEDYDWIKKNLKTYEVKGDYHFNSQFLSCILRLADILDIDSNRTPYNLYKLIAPKGKSDEEWKQHFVISNNEKIIFNDKTQQKKIVFHGTATNAGVHRKILDYIGWVKSELVNSTSLVNNMYSQYNLLIDVNPEINIATEGYTFSDYKMTLEYRAISALLMGEKIYGDKSLGLRELIQNSIDACRIRQETIELKKEFGEDAYVPKIKIILDEEKQQAIIKDNGIGMSIEIIKRHFLNIGVSYYLSDDFLLKDFDYKPIGNFGIGFLSCFMLSDEVSVITRFYNSKSRYLIQLEKGDEYTSLTEVEDVLFEGTEVILKYNEFIKIFENKVDNVKKFLCEYFLTDGIEFEIIDKGKKEKEKIFNHILIDRPSDRNIIKIDLNEYLHDIDGYALIKKSDDFIRSLEDISFEGELFEYKKDVGIIEVTDEVIQQMSIDDYVVDNTIEYISIPLVTEEDVEKDFLNGMKFTNSNVEEVIKKMDRELYWISILLPKNYKHYLYNKTIQLGENILEYFSHQDLLNLGHYSSCTTQIFIKKITLFEGERNNLYVPFNNEEKKNLYFYKRQYHTDGKDKELFIRSVLIKEFYFNMPTSASIFKLVKLVANVSSRKFIPDISRNNLDYASRYLLNYIIGKAVHIGAKNSLDLDEKEKYTLDKFIEKFYAEKTDFEL